MTFASIYDGIQIFWVRLWSSYRICTFSTCWLLRSGWLRWRFFLVLIDLSWNFFRCRSVICINQRNGLWNVLFGVDGLDRLRLIYSSCVMEVIFIDLTHIWIGIESRSWTKILSWWLIKHLSSVGNRACIWIKWIAMQPIDWSAVLVNLVVGSLNVRIKTARSIDRVLSSRVLVKLASLKVTALPHIPVVSYSHLEESATLNVVWSRCGSLSLALGCELRTLASLGRIVVGREEIIANWCICIEFSFVLAGRCVHFTVLNCTRSIQLIIRQCSRFQRRISVLVARFNSGIPLFRKEIPFGSSCTQITMQVIRTASASIRNHNGLTWRLTHKDILLRLTYVFPSVWWWAPVTNMFVLHWLTEVRIALASISLWFWAWARSYGCVVLGVRSLGCVAAHFCILSQI